LRAASSVKYQSLFCYPWDVLDEGPAAFARLVKEAGLTHISLASTYHEGKVLAPHNPRRRVYFVEEGAIYMPPSPRYFGRTRMKPRVSRWTAGRDAWKEITEACRAQGVGTTAWTVSLHNSYLGWTYPQYTTQNAFGDRYVHALCPAHPAVVEYLRALAGNIASYATDAIDFESFEFISYEHYAFLEKEGIEVTPMANLLLSLCFCEGCLGAAKRAGVDGGKVQAAVKRRLEVYFEGEERDRAPVETQLASVPGLADYLEVRFGSLENCFKEVAAAVREHKKKVIYMIMGDRFPNYTAGIDLARIAAHADSIEFLFYGRRPEQAPAAVRNIHSATKRNAEIYLVVRPGYPDAQNAAGVIRLAQAAAQAGATGVSYYNFGLFERSHLGWVRQAVGSI
jgi:hypothetical protein